MNTERRDAERKGGSRRIQRNSSAILNASLRLCVQIFALSLPFISFVRAQSPAPQPQRKLAIEFDAGLGFGRHQPEVKMDAWYPAWIVLKANEANARGTLTIMQEDNPLRVSIPFDVAKGTTKRFRAAFKLLDWSNINNKYEVVLDDEKLGRERYPIAFAGADEDDHHILILCDDVGSFGFLTRRITRDKQDRPGAFGERRAIYGSPELLPDDPVLLETLDAIVVSTSDLKKISPAAWKAMESWVWLGGRLLLAVGKDQPFLEGSALRGAFGLEAARSEPASLEASLGDDAGTTQTRVLASWPANPPQFWDKAWLGPPERPLIAGKRCGDGWFDFSSIALDEAALAALNSRPGAANLWTAMLERRATPPDLIRKADANSSSTGLRLQMAFDVALAGTMKALLKELRKMGKTILISSHILSELADLCDLVAIIERGTLLAFGNLKEIGQKMRQHRALEIQLPASSPALTEILSSHPDVVGFEEFGGLYNVNFVGDNNALIELNQRMVQSGAPVMTVREKEASIEEMFMKITTGAVQ